MKVLFLLLLAFNLMAQNEFSVRTLYGSASANDLGQIILGNLGSEPEDLTVMAMDGGYLLQHNSLHYPIDIYAKVGVSKFYEDRYRDVYEVVAYLKLFYNVDFLENRLRFGFGEGGSYTNHILRAEFLEAQEEHGKTSYFLNYLDITADFDLGKLLHSKSLYTTYIGIALKHRSGIFGLINNVRHGGSNYNSLYIEKNF